jgi:predicted nucleic acid-binding protein
VTADAGGEAKSATRRLDDDLGPVERVLLDSSALIAFHSPHEAAHPLAKHLLERIERDSDPLTGYVSIISTPELLVRPLRAGPREFAFMHTFLTKFPHLSVLPLDMTVAVQAATLRATTGIRLPDAISLASGLLAGCEAIVTNDEQWLRKLAPLFRQFRWIYLGNYG